ASAIKSGLPMPFTSISAGWIFTLMGLLDDGRPLNQGKSPERRHQRLDRRTPDNVYYEATARKVI
uniref:hypothetical protein n=1 Tax=Thiolapillus sp. TaxID=2017437 RepID=UPI003AF79FD8